MSPRERRDPAPGAEPRRRSAVLLHGDRTARLGPDGLVPPGAGWPLPPDDDRSPAADAVRRVLARKRYRLILQRARELREVAAYWQQEAA